MAQALILAVVSVCIMFVIAMQVVGKDKGNTIILAVMLLYTVVPIAIALGGLINGGFSDLFRR